MFARLTITQMKKERQQEGVNLYQESAAPVVKAQKGFRGAYLLSDPETGKGISISLWESREDAVASEKSGYYQEQITKFKEIFAEPPVQEGYEVTVQVD